MDQALTNELVIKTFQEAIRELAIDVFERLVSELAFEYEQAYNQHAGREATVQQRITWRAQALQRVGSMFLDEPLKAPPGKQSKKSSRPKPAPVRKRSPG